MIYGWSGEYSALKLQISLTAAAVENRDSAAGFSLPVLNVFPEENTASASLLYSVVDAETSRFFKVASFNVNYCKSLSFSFSGSIVHTRFFSLNAVDDPWVLLADSAALSKLNFTVSPLATASRLHRQKSPEYRNRECRVFLNQVVYLNKGVLRL